MASCLMFLAMFCSFALYAYGSLYAAETEDATWSFEFNDMPLSDVLGELSRATGIDIFSNGLPENRTLNKRFVNQTVDQIVKDVFKGVNFALVWHHGEKGIHSLDIWIFDGGGGRSTSFSKVGGRRAPPTAPFGYEEKAGSAVGSEDDSNDADAPDENADEFAPHSPELGEEGEQESSDPVAESDAESGVDRGNLPQVGPDEDAEVEDSPPVPIKTPDLD